MKNLKQTLASNCKASTALCIDWAPSGPRSASPGPNIVENVEVITASSSQPIAATDEIKNRREIISLLFCTYWPILSKLNPAIIAACELIVLRIIVQKFSSLSRILSV